MSGSAPRIDGFLKPHELAILRIRLQRQASEPVPAARRVRHLKRDESQHRLAPGQPENRALYVWWFDRHSYSLKVIATVSGVSSRTVQRWRKAKALPMETACMVDQLKNGLALQMSLFRGRASARQEWFADIKKTGCFKPVKEIPWTTRR